MKKSWLLGLISLFSSFFAFGQKAEIFSDRKGAIQGYDPVAFFTDGKAVVGKEDITVTWNEAVWHFVSESNKSLFIESPEKYAPQYGGYCAYGTAKNHKSPTQPAETWTIVDGKLYFNYNPEVKKLWMADQQKMIIEADRNWVTLRKK